jgi:hypothetical protein
MKEGRKGEEVLEKSMDFNLEERQRLPILLS